MFTQGRFLLRISRHTHGFSITRMYFDLLETIAAYITVGDARCVPESSFRFARDLYTIEIRDFVGAYDQCAASRRIFCTRQFKSSATYSSLSEGQAIS
jgi:hypothetical protein